MLRASPEMATERGMETGSEGNVETRGNLTDRYFDATTPLKDG